MMNNFDQYANLVIRRKFFVTRWVAQSSSFELLRSFVVIHLNRQKKIDISWCFCEVQVGCLSNL
jgi:hypothetical protein